MTDDEFLRDALDDAVSDVEPTDRLGAIRARTSRPTRSYRWTIAGAVLPAAALVAVVAVVATGGSDEGGVEPYNPAAPSTTATADLATPSDTTSDPTDPTDATGPTGPTGPTEAVALYFVGDTPAGPLLFREFQQVPQFDPATDYLDSVLDALDAPDDPDYRTAWPAGTVSAQVIEGEVRVQLEEGATDDLLELQQLRDTLAAATGVESMTFYRGAQPFTVARDDTLLAPVSISDPTEAKPISGAFTARGVADSFEATVPWRVLDASGEAVLSGFATAGGFGRLHPWETRVDVSGLAPGTYTFEASTSDPSGGEGPGAAVDTRTITVT